MPDLEQQIAQWRRQMLAAGIKTPVPLDELESHLRDEMEQLAVSGLSAKEAFAAAVRQIGQPNVLGREFRKVERTLMKKLMIIAAGIFGVLSGPAIFLPALAKHRHEGVWGTEVVVPILVGAVITLVGAILTIYGFRRRKAS
jgi:drug/metabolite transporter (DMT)-like permease